MVKNIILVEDDVAISEALLIAFQDTYYNLICLADVAEIMNGKFLIPDMYILDRHISGGDGLDVCRYIKKTNALAHVPVIMLSANPDIIHLANAAGADHAITKPFSLKELREAIGCYLDQ